MSAELSSSTSFTPSSTTIGQGTYGCLHRPSLKCSPADKNTPPNINYEKKVSKIMHADYAEDEYAEYEKLSKLDPKGEYFLKMPIKCKPEASEYNINSIKECKDTVSLTEFMIHPKAYSLLIMEDGEMDFQEYIQFYHPIMKLDKLEKLFIEFHNVFLGIKLLIDNNIIHNDLKMNNLLINQKTGKITIIDFGYATNKIEAIKSCKKSQFGKANKFYYTHPFEMVFTNKKMFSLAQKNIKNKQYDFFKKLFSDKQVKDFFSYIRNKEDIQKIKREWNYYILNNFLKKRGDGKMQDFYSKFLEKHFNTYDIYGMGIVCFYLLQKCGKRLLNPSVFNSFYNIFYNMITPNLNDRFEIDELIAKYAHTLYTTGLLQKHGDPYNKVKLENTTQDFERLINATKSPPKDVARTNRINLDSTPPAAAKTVKKINMKNNKLYSLLLSGSGGGLRKTSKQK